MRACGMLLPVSSLPSPYGIGAFSESAYRFVDTLKEAGQKYWQILPLGPTGYGDSPYQTDSAFAGNPYLIDLEQLITDGLLTREEVDAVSFGSDPAQTDYGALYAGRFDLLRRACERGWDKKRENVDAFYRENESWLRSYALYTAAKRHFGMRPWIEWEDEDLRLRRSEEVLRRYEELLAEDIRFCIFTQYLFFRQWNALRAYIREQGIRIIGDVPIYVPLDSADVWAEGEYFQLDDQCRPTEVAGVPPDYFTADGQLWGNPLYDWDAMKDDGYRWWIERVRNQLDQVDYIRIDHFRGFEAYWAVPAGEETAMNGKWKKGPGEALFEAIQKALGEELPIFAEDLGIITPEVEKLRDTLGFPGMKILQFGFDGTGESTFLPHQLSTRNCICYTGTHDNDTTCGWYEHTNEQNKDKVRRYMNTDASSVSWDFIRTCLGTIAKYAIFPVQDLLKLGSEHRMNTPGTATGNWEFRYRSGLLDEGMAKGLKQMTELFGRWG